MLRPFCIGKESLFLCKSTKGRDSVGSSSMENSRLVESKRTVSSEGNKIIPQRFSTRSIGSCRALEERVQYLTSVLDKVSLKQCVELAEEFIYVDIEDSTGDNYWRYWLRFVVWLKDKGANWPPSVDSLLGFLVFWLACF